MHSREAWRVLSLPRGAGRLTAPTTPLELQSCPQAVDSWWDWNLLAGWVVRWWWRRGGCPGPATAFRGAEERGSGRFQPQRSAAASRMAVSRRPESTGRALPAKRRRLPAWPAKAGSFEVAAAVYI